MRNEKVVRAKLKELEEYISQGIRYDINNIPHYPVQNFKYPIKNHEINVLKWVLGLKRNFKIIAKGSKS